MKTIGLLLVGLLCASTMAYAGEVITNDTGEDATELRVAFSTPVLITAFGDVLTSVDPQMLAFEFVFSGGIVEPWGSQWFNYSPATAQVIETEWLPPTAEHPSDARAADHVYDIDLPGIDVQISLARHIDRNCLPFSVWYEATNIQSLDQYTLAWDVDKYIDSDADGNPQNDRDYQGSRLYLTYTENYNPTITLLICDLSGSIVASWENMARNDFCAGQRVVLDGNALLQISGISVEDAESVEWEQLHMERVSFEYMTEYNGDIVPSAEPQAELFASAAGRYVIEMRVLLDGEGVASERVAAWFVEVYPAAKGVGIHMLDVWNETYNARTNRMYEHASDHFTDSEARAKLMYLDLQGFESISAVDIVAFEEQIPLPVLTDVGWAMIVGPEDSEWIFAKADSGQLRFSTEIAWNPDPAQNVNYYEEHAFELPQEYFAEFFRQYDAAAVEEARVAEQLGLEAFDFGPQHPYLQRLCAISNADPNLALWIWEQWKNLATEVRKVFSGQIGFEVPGGCSGCRVFPGVLDTVDFLSVSLTNSGGLSEQMLEASSSEELRFLYGDYVEQVLAPIQAMYPIPLRVTIRPLSHMHAQANEMGWGAAPDELLWMESYQREFASGDYSQAILTGEVLPEFSPDFRAQVRVVEAMAPVLAGHTYVESIYSAREYWTILDFDPFAPAGALRYRNVYDSALQGKPAFEAYRLWASILDPNERLLYRKLIPFEDESGTQLDEAFSNFDWDSLPVRLAYQEPVQPPSVWTNGGSASISTAQYWGLQGSQIRSVSAMLGSDSIAIHWEAFDTVADSVYDYDFRFSDSNGEYEAIVQFLPRTRMVTMHLYSSSMWGTVYFGRASIYLKDTEGWLVLSDFVIPEGFPFGALKEGGFLLSLRYTMTSKTEEFPFHTWLGSPSDASKATSPDTEAFIVPSSAFWGVDYTSEDTVEVGTSPHGIGEIDGRLTVVDWRDGAISQLSEDAPTESLGKLDDNFVCDFVVAGSDIIYATFKRGKLDLVRFPIGGRESTRVRLPDPGIEYEDIFGIELQDNKLVLLLNTESGSVLASYTLDSEAPPTLCRVTCPAVELLGLEYYEGQLYSFDWPQGLIYAIEDTDDEEILRCAVALNAATMILPNERSGGGFRGFAITDGSIYITSVSAHDGEPGRVHRLEFESE